MKPITLCVKYENNAFVFLDQSVIPHHENYIATTKVSDVIEAIKALKIRGAPAIGIAGAFACALAVKENSNLNDLHSAFDHISNARPTAVNLSWAVQEQKKIVEKTGLKAELFDRLLENAKKIHEEDISNNLKIATLGAAVLPTHQSVLTHCNTGDLATGGIGTALGVIAMAHELKKIQHVYSSETRPVLQGLRLTCWELKKRQIPFTALCDSMAASLMADKKIGAVLVGADRIAKNGDTANKVGTFNLAILCKHFQIPFFVVAPTSTIDLKIEDKSGIPIEQRNAEEVTKILNCSVDYNVYNPSFDITPHNLITAIICEKGVFEPKGGSLF